MHQLPVEKLQVGTAKSFYKLSLDGGYDRDVEVEGAIRGSFSVHPKTKLIGQVSSGATILTLILLLDLEPQVNWQLYIMTQQLVLFLIHPKP